ncbi:hypothetical protein TWF694_004304 [Orbilia ellipsospora]|uniref:Cell wall galactomannoprotein n=1 Tax=Orbilia ellipsospora TaxID=2528407 RepID=A0AAV9X059_9PEZI
MHALKFSLSAALVVFSVSSMAVPLHHSFSSVTPSDVAAGLRLLSTRTDQIEQELVVVTTSSSGATVSTKQYTVVNLLNTIIDDMRSQTDAFKATSPFSDTQDEVMAQWTTLGGEVQESMRTLLGKHSIFAQFGVTAPIAAVLRSYEEATDDFVAALVELVPSNADTISQGGSALSTVVGTVITQYQEVCIPSPLYPILMPICTSAFSSQTQSQRVFKTSRRLKSQSKSC